MHSSRLSHYCRNHVQCFSAPSISSLCPLKTFAAWQDARFGGICRGRHHSRYPIFLDASLYSSVSRFRRLSPFTIHVRTVLLLLIALHTPPLRSQAPNDRQTRQDHTHQKALSERFVVRLQHCRRSCSSVLFRDRRLQSRHAICNHECSVDPGSLAAQLLQQLGRKEILADGQEDGAAEALRQEQRRGPERDVGARDDCLHRRERHLHAKTGTEAE